MKWLLTMMLLSLSMEVPDIYTTRRAQHKADVQAMVKINDTVIHEYWDGKDPTLVSADVDAALLAAVQYFEGRYRINPRDGDCRPVPNGTGWKHVCSAYGPMQIGKGSARWLTRWNTAYVPWSTVIDGGPITRAKLREPEWNVRGGYEIIRHWKLACGGLPGVWLTAYGWGRCPKTGYVDREGVRRCALATAILRRAGKEPEGWKCGHEGRRILGRDAKLVRHVLTAAL